MISWNNLVTDPADLICTAGLTTIDSEQLIKAVLGGLGQITTPITTGGGSLNAVFTGSLPSYYPIACVGLLGLSSPRAVAIEIETTVEFGASSITSAKHEQLIIGRSDIIIPTPFDERAAFDSAESIAATLEVQSETGSEPITFAQFWAAPGVQCAARYTMPRGTGSQVQRDRGHSGAMSTSNVGSWLEYDVELICNTAFQFERPGGLYELQKLGEGTEVVVLPSGRASGTVYPDTPLNTRRGNRALALHGRISSPVVAVQIGPRDEYTRVTFRVEECL